MSIPGLTVITGRVTVSDNPMLNTIDLPSLASVDACDSSSSRDGYLYIERNPMLGNLDGLGALTTVAGSFRITENDVLATRNGLINLTSINCGVHSSMTNPVTAISLNPSLTSLGLDSYTTICRNWLYVTSNPLLPTCEVEAVFGPCVDDYCSYSGNDDIAVCP